jgi:hypothetical protein
MRRAARTGFILNALTALLVGCSGSAAPEEAKEQPPSPPPAAEQTPAAASQEETSPPPPKKEPKGVVLDCAMQSMADFGDAFGDPQNLVVDPLVLVGGAMPVSEAVVLAHDGQKFPLLVRAGRTVTVEIPSAFRKTTGLAYGPLPQGRVRVSDAHDSIRFVSCGRDEAGSTARGPVTFWSGFVMTSVPICLPLDVYVDDDATPRRVRIALGKPCVSA